LSEAHRFTKSIGPLKLAWLLIDIYWGLTKEKSTIKFKKIAGGGL
jgi:hypothetical protein